MEPLKATVKAGRLVLDEPTDLPEGTVIELYPDPPAEMSAEERERLDAALEESVRDYAAGHHYSVDEVFASLPDRS